MSGTSTDSDPHSHFALRDSRLTDSDCFDSKTKIENVPIDRAVDTELTMQGCELRYPGVLQNII